MLAHANIAGKAAIMINKRNYNNVNAKLNWLECVIKNDINRKIKVLFPKFS